jgi:hypothetical protein
MFTHCSLRATPSITQVSRRYWLKLFYKLSFSYTGNCLRGSFPFEHCMLWVSGAGKECLMLLLPAQLSMEVAIEMHRREHSLTPSYIVTFKLYVFTYSLSHLFLLGSILNFVKNIKFVTVFLQLASRQRREQKRTLLGAVARQRPVKIHWEDLVYAVVKCKVCWLARAL